MSNLKSLKSFKANIKDESKIKGGLAPNTPIEKEDRPSNVGTYVDGVKTGWDGDYQD